MTTRMARLRDDLRPPATRTGTAARGPDPRPRRALEVLRVWGIPIVVDASWLVVFALVTLSLAAGYLPETHPGWRSWTYWLAGALASLTFFASIVAHELAHAWVARRHGMAIRHITLFVFGGVAQIGRATPSPAVELRVALAGPATSLAIAAAFRGVAALVGDIDVLAGPAAWLAYVNLLVAAFNLIPGFPLDGGRVLRALVWRVTGDFARATRAAARTGQLVASTLMALGVLVLVGGNVLSGVWLAVIGWFLRSAASAEQAHVVVTQVLGDVPVAQLMTATRSAVTADMPVAEIVAHALHTAGPRWFLVTDGGHVVSLLTTADIGRVPRERRAAVRAAEIAVPVDRLLAVTPDETLAAALAAMEQAGAERALVAAEGEVVGVLDRARVLEYVRMRAELGA